MRQLDVERARQEFPILQRWAYLDTAGVGPVPARTLAAASKFASDYATEGITRPWQVMETVLAEVREAYAALLGVAPATVIPIGTSSEGINAVAHALPWRDGDNLVTSDLEYPSNFYPWINLKRGGVEVRVARSRDGALSVEDIRPLVDERTRVITATHVAYLSGYRCDLAAVAGFARPRNILTVVDATQGLGAVRLDAAAAGVDVVAVSGLKWLLSPIGTGMLYVRPEVLDRLQPAYVSWMSMRDHQAKGLSDVDLADDARRFMVSGNFDLAAFAGMTASLRWLTALGPDAIEQRVLELSGRLIEGCERIGLRAHTPTDPARRAGIVTVRVPDAEATLERLRAAGIHGVARLDGVRLSPHFFITSDEIDTALEVLA